MTTTYPPTYTPKRKLVTVEVSQEDIDTGRPRKLAECPFALALIRAGYMNPVVGGHRASAIPPESNYWIEWRNSTRLARWIERYDEHRPVKPARFRLPIGKLVEG